MLSPTVIIWRLASHGFMIPRPLQPLPDMQLDSLESLSISESEWFSVWDTLVIKRGTVRKQPQPGGRRNFRYSDFETALKYSIPNARLTNELDKSFQMPHSSDHFTSLKQYTHYPNEWGWAQLCVWKISDGDTKLLKAIRLVPPEQLDGFVHPDTIHSWKKTPDTKYRNKLRHHRKQKACNTRNNTPSTKEDSLKATWNRNGTDTSTERLSNSFDGACRWYPRLPSGNPSSSYSWRISTKRWLLQLAQGISNKSSESRGWKLRSRAYGTTNEIVYWCLQRVSHLSLRGSLKPTIVSRFECPLTPPTWSSSQAMAVSRARDALFTYLRNR